MSKDLVFNGPAEFEMQLMVINDENEQSARVTIGLGTFEYPDKEKVDNRIKKFVTEELTGTLSGFRLMTKREAWDSVMYEKTGERYAMAGGKEWDEI